MPEHPHDRPPVTSQAGRSPLPKQEHSFPSAEAQQFLDELARKFEQFILFSRGVSNVSLTTCRGYRDGVRNLRTFFLLQAQQGADLRVKFYAIAEWVIWNRNRAISPVSVRTYWRAVAPFYRYLEQVEHIQNPFRAMCAPGIPARLPKARTAVECRHILSTANNYPWRSNLQRARASAIFGVLLFTGLRRGEVLRLEYVDLNLDEGTIRVRGGKGRHGGKDRVAYVNAELSFLLRDYLRERQRNRYTCPSLFVSTRANQGLSLSQFIRIVRTVRAASGIQFSIHSLRHSFVTQLLRSGIPIHIAKELAGHSDINTTIGYVRVWDEEKRSQIHRLKF